MNAAHANVKGLPAVRLRAGDGSLATIMLHGAQVVSWVPAGAPEQLYLSEQAVFAPDQAIRGGAPVIFPQFDRVGPDPRAPRHGLARTRAWRLAKSGEHDDRVFACLELTEDAHTLAAWPHRFALALTVELSARQLKMTLEAANPGDDAFSFTAALHTYLKVADIGQARIEGLGGLRYHDSTLTPPQGGSAWHDDRLSIESRDVVDFDGEVDRIYVDARQRLHLREYSLDARQPSGDGACVDLTMNGFEDVVVWNPGADKAAKLSDLPRNGYRQMVCIEAARIARPVTLAPGQRWSGEQTLHLACVA